MSLEIWGDEGDLGPEGYVTDESAKEMAEDAFHRGAQMMREMLARFVEHAGDKKLAASLRANWNPAWGNDIGEPSPESYGKAMTGHYDCFNW